VHICDVKVHGGEQSSLSRANTPTPDCVPSPLQTVSEKVDQDHRNHNVQSHITPVLNRKQENGMYLGPLGTPDVTILNPSSPCPSTPMTLVAEPNGGASDLPSNASPRDSLKRTAVEGDQISDVDPSSSDSGVVTRCSVVKPLKLRFCHPLLGKKLTKPKRELIDMGRVSTTKARDPEKEKRRIARKKEKRATLILGLIMGSFIACWFPFFFMYILVPICPWCSIPNIAFDMAFWLGYMNSAFNPIIYTIFNKDFRR
ncbi:unnamed protein product, partial [Meganyctiphanes norvegica]